MKQKIESRGTIYKLIRFKGIDIEEIYLEPKKQLEFEDPAILNVDFTKEILKRY